MTFGGTEGLNVPRGPPGGLGAARGLLRLRAWASFGFVVSMGMGTGAEIFSGKGASESFKGRKGWRNEFLFDPSLRRPAGDLGAPKRAPERERVVRWPWVTTACGGMLGMRWM